LVKPELQKAIAKCPQLSSVTKNEDAEMKARVKYHLFVSSNLLTKLWPEHDELQGIEMMLRKEWGKIQDKKSRGRPTAINAFIAQRASCGLTLPLKMNTNNA
jgi:hypothetical protein